MITEKRDRSFGRVALSQVPRVLGLCDRRPDSPLQGCFDRLYWNYRITDFPTIWMQDGALLLALLYSRSFTGNVYHGKEAMREWSRRAAAFWARSLHADGSGDEVYPYERSVCATAFSACAVSEALLVLGDDPPKQLVVCGRWLQRHTHPDPGNQLAAVALALFNIGLLCSDSALQCAADSAVRCLLESQTQEGYFPEYGGVDIGYLSITLSLLARLYSKNGSEVIRGAAMRALDFLGTRIRPDGTYDNTATSRRTQYLYPYGFAYFGSNIIERIQRGLQADRLINPSWLDDRYTIPMTIDYVQTSLWLGE